MGRTAYTALLACQRKFRQHGQSGTWVSDWYPEIATCVDDIAVLRSCTADGLNHVGSVCQMNTGSVLAGRPSPRLVDPLRPGLRERGPARLRRAARLSGRAARRPPQLGHRLHAGGVPGHEVPRRHDADPAPRPARAAFRRRGSGTSSTSSASSTSCIAARRTDDDQLEARIAAYELAYRMQSAAPEAVDLSDETAETRRLYGLDQKETAHTGRNCLLARRLVERGVRFVQLYFGSGSKWDAHADMEGNHSRYCRESDRPIAGLLKDLKQRGLLDSTLVIWGGEFGRTPMSESGNGRDHNPYGFTMWMAGGGVRGGVTLRRDRRDRPVRRREQSPRPRHPRHDPALLRPRPRAADVPAQRPRRTADGQRRQGDRSDSCISSSFQ